MKQLTLDDVRTALYEMNVPEVRNTTEESLPKADFWFDLGMDEREVFMLMSNLERGHHILLPSNVNDSLKMKNTVGTLLHAMNRLLVDLDEQ